MIDALLIIWTFLIGVCVGICIGKKRRKKFVAHKVNWHLKGNRCTTPFKCEKEILQLQKN